MDTSLAQKSRSLADIHITNNDAYGVVCSVPPAVAQIVGVTFQRGNISGNPAGDVDQDVTFRRPRAHIDEGCAARSGFVIDAS